MHKGFGKHCLPVGHDRAGALLWFLLILGRVRAGGSGSLEPSKVHGSSVVPVIPPVSILAERFWEDRELST